MLVVVVKCFEDVRDIVFLFVCLVCDLYVEKLEDEVVVCCIGGLICGV